GWLRDEDARITQLTAVSPEGSRAELLERVFFNALPELPPSPDVPLGAAQVPATGFAGSFELEVPSYLPAGWTIELRDDAGYGLEAGAPAVIREPVIGRDTILAALSAVQRY